MAAPVKHLYLTPVIAEPHIYKYELKNENTNGKPPVVLMKNTIVARLNNFKLALPTGKGIYYFSPKEIIRLEAKNNCTKFFLINNSSLLICKTLKEFEMQLNDHGFIRTHKSHLINKNFIAPYLTAGAVVMLDNSTVSISRRKRKKIADLLKR